MPAYVLYIDRILIFGHKILFYFSNNLRWRHSMHIWKLYKEIYNFMIDNIYNNLHVWIWIINDGIHFRNEFLNFSNSLGGDIPYIKIVNLDEIIWSVKLVSHVSDSNSRKINNWKVINVWLDEILSMVIRMASPRKKKIIRMVYTQ